MIREENLRLVASGLAGGLSAVVAPRAFGVRRASIVVVAAAVAIAILLSSRADRPARVDGYLVFGGVVVAAGAVGSWNVVRLSLARTAPFLVAAMVSCVAVGLAVPETGPAVVGVGVIVGLLAASLATSSTLSPLAAAGIAGVVGWAALSGAAGWPWATVGGALCLGLAPWLAVVPRWRKRDWPRLASWLLVAHGLVALAAARWIGVSDGGWLRVLALAAVGALVAGLTTVRTR